MKCGSQKVLFIMSSKSILLYTTQKAYRISYDLMQKDTNGDVDEKEPLFNHNRQSDDRQHCNVHALIIATTFMFMAISCRQVVSQSRGRLRL